ncbi:hypothetical protein LZ198_16465 [Myxococcus sp. K15C18031901]|uniref:hypothetical protein n=1 Tax=Myxococcus dinghuensis TaxID=2906761 RepID=UPI0020A6F816|nr:hypothetical protein [Myxococcus dinghuensis]MCP3100464.1 hypothetical protein [Myxococcus dinghuensis]
MQRTAQMRDLAEVGRYDEAMKELDAVAAQEGMDPLLVAVDRGALLHRAGDWRASTRALEQAAELADEHEVVRLTEEVSGNIPWRMGVLERQTLHTLNALNYLQLGRADEAAVEARLSSALNLQRHLEERHHVDMERHLLIFPIDEELRPYLVQSAIGLYVSGLAHEVAGNEDSAFIDYLAAWRITQAAPPGAPSRMHHLGPWLVAEARRLGRPELAELERALPASVAPALTEREGELVVIVEAGRVPERCMAQRGFDTKNQIQSVCPRPWMRGRAVVEVADGTWKTETVTSLENILLRRADHGVALDTIRRANLWSRMGTLGVFLVLPPLGGFLWFRAAIAYYLVSEQSWLSLPAEFQVARITLPAGRHAVRILRGGEEQVREVDIAPRRVQVLVVSTE